MLNITSYEVGLYLFAVFMTFFGLLFLWMSANAPHRDQERRLFRKILNIKSGFFCLGMIYLAMGTLSIYGAYGLNIEYGWNAPCENLLINSTTTVGVTEYNYVNSCASRVVPPLNTTIFTLFTYVLILDIFAAFIAIVILFWDGVFKRW